VVPKVLFTDTKESTTNTQGTLGYIYVMVSLKFTFIFNYRNNVLLKIIVELL
jgi:hypothetical protein